jgi:hypothetical protein
MYGAMMLAPDLAQAALGQALLAQAALAEAQMQVANAQAQMQMQQAQMMQAQMAPQAFSALSPFAAAAPQPAPVAAPAPIGLGALLAKAFPRPLIDCWGGVSKAQFDLINQRRTGAPLLPFGAEPELAPLGVFSQFLPRTLRDSLSEPYGFTAEQRWRSQPLLGAAISGAQLLPFGAQPPVPDAPAPQPSPGIFSRIAGLSGRLDYNPWRDPAFLAWAQNPQAAQMLPFAALQQMMPFAAEPELEPMFIPPTAQQMLEISRRFPALFGRSLLPQQPFGLPDAFPSPGGSIGSVLAGQPPTGPKPQMPWQLASPPLP